MRKRLAAVLGYVFVGACATGAEREAGAIDGRVEAARQAEAACLAGTLTCDTF